MEQSYGPVGHSQKATYMWHLGDNDCILFKHPLVPYFSNCARSWECTRGVVVIYRTSGRGYTTYVCTRYNVYTNRWYQYMCTIYERIHI